MPTTDYLWGKRVRGDGSVGASYHAFEIGGAGTTPLPRRPLCDGGVLADGHRAYFDNYRPDAQFCCKLCSMEYRRLQRLQLPFRVRGRYR